MALLKSVAGNQVTLASGATATFPFPVADAINFKDVVVVRLEPPRGTIFDENVFGIEADGHTIWQIQPEYPPTQDASWGGLEERDGNAVVSNWESKICYIDPKTGKVVRRGMSAR
jgi:hypothetical protein